MKLSLLVAVPLLLGCLRTARHGSVQLVVWPLDLIVAFPALFWGGVYLWRRQPLGYVVGGVVLLKAAAEGLTLVVQTVATVMMGGPGDPLVPVYGILGLGGLALLIAFLRSTTERTADASPAITRHLPSTA